MELGWRTHNEDDTELLDQCPFQCVLITAVGGVDRGRLVFPECCAATLLLDECVGNKVIDEGRVDGGVGAGPEDDTRGGDDLEGVEHREGCWCARGAPMGGDKIFGVVEARKEKDEERR